MNPPFTRDSLRHDQLGKAGEAQVKRKEKQLIKQHPHQGAARLHSSGGMFLLLGEHLTKNAGTLAVVLPAVTATSYGNLAFRKFFAQQFHIDDIRVELTR